MSSRNEFFYAVLRARRTIAVTRPLVLRLLLCDHVHDAGVGKTDANHTSLSTALVYIYFNFILCKAQLYQFDFMALWGHSSVTY